MKGSARSIAFLALRIIFSFSGPAWTVKTINKTQANTMAMPLLNVIKCDGSYFFVIALVIMIFSPNRSIVS